MNVKPFARAVKFMAGPGFVRHVTNTEEALYFIEHRWPYQKGDTQIAAAAKCREVLGGRGSAEDAKAAFIEALEDAHFDLVD